jgi:hypothetical protein
MKYYLVRYTGNWAEEFDVYFHMVMSGKELNEIKDVIASTDWYREEFYFGTNEALDFSTYELMSFLENAEEITEEQYKVLEELDLLSVSFGDGLNWDSILEHANEQLDNE